MHVFRCLITIGLVVVELAPTTASAQTPYGRYQPVSPYVYHRPVPYQPAPTLTSLYPAGAVTQSPVQTAPKLTVAPMQQPSAIAPVAAHPASYAAQPYRPARSPDAYQYPPSPYTPVPVDNATQRAILLPPDKPSWYGGIIGGMSFIGEPRTRSDEDPALNVRLNTGSGLFSGLVFGYRTNHTGNFSDYIRLESEFSYRRNNMDSVTFLEGPLAGRELELEDEEGNFRGNYLSAKALMANVYLEPFDGATFRPYIGGGAGAAMVNYGKTETRDDDSDIVFAYQGMAGIYYTPSQMPNTEWGIGYRYFKTGDPEYKFDDGESITTEFESHNAELTARLFF